MAPTLNGIAAGPQTPEATLRARINNCRSQAWELLRQADQYEAELRHLYPDARLVFARKSHYLNKVVHHPRYMMVKMETVQPWVNAIILAICNRQGVEMRIVLGKTQVQQAVMARAMIIWLVHEILHVPFTEIGRRLVYRSHSTIIHSYRTICCEMARRPEFRKRMEALREELSRKQGEPV
jgi:Bacterial dnaA protein helix-turn-helix